MTGGTRVERAQVAVNQQGHYAGAVSRLVAFVVDQSVAAVVFAATTAVVAWILSLVTAGELTFDPHAWFAGLIYLAWLFFYFSYPWAVSGKTFGMALLGIRVVRRDGSRAGTGNAVKRTLALPLSFMTLGIGFLPIIFGRERRALHDAIAGTAVVYSWDARGAKLRFLARQQRSDEIVPAP